MTAAPAISGVSHLDLSVSDVHASAAWYERVLELSRSAQVTLAERTMVVLVHPGSGLVIGLNQHHDRAGGGGQGHFDERRVGLDHVGLAVDHRHDLDVWEARLTALGVTHSPVADTEHGAALVFRDPDNIQLELWWSKPTEPRGREPGQSSGVAGAGRAAIIERESPLGAGETVARLVAEAEAMGVTVFTTIDHAANARTADLTMPETQVVIVGNPAVGTPAMLEAPDLALELPTRLLVRSTRAGHAGSTVVFADPAATARRFGLSPAAAAGLAGVVALVERALDPGGPGSGAQEIGGSGSGETS